MVSGVQIRSADLITIVMALASQSMLLANAVLSVLFGGLPIKAILA